MLWRAALVIEHLHSGGGAFEWRQATVLKKHEGREVAPGGKVIYACGQ